MKFDWFVPKTGLRYEKGWLPGWGVEIKQDVSCWKLPLEGERLKKRGRNMRRG